MHPWMSWAAYTAELRSVWQKLAQVLRCLDRIGKYSCINDLERQLEVTRREYLGYPGLGLARLQGSGPSLNITNGIYRVKQKLTYHFSFICNLQKKLLSITDQQSQPRPSRTLVHLTKMISNLNKISHRFCELAYFACSAALAWNQPAELARMMRNLEQRLKSEILNNLRNLSQHVHVL